MKKILVNIKEEKVMKKILGMLLALTMVFALCACDANTNEESSDTSSTGTDEMETETPSAEATSGEKEVIPVKIGFIFDSFSGTLGQSAQRMCNAAAEALDFEIEYVECEVDTTAQLNAVQNLLSAGCNGIMITPNGETHLNRILNLCEENDAYMIMVFSKIEDEDIKEACFNSPNFLGYIFEDEQATAYSMVEYLASQGKTNFAINTCPPGFNSIDNRIAGYRKAIEELDLNLSFEYSLNFADPVGSVGEMVDNAATLYTDTEVILQVSGNNGLAEAGISAIRDNNIVGEVQIATYDMYDGMVSAYEDEIVTLTATGHFIDPFWGALILWNQLEGTPYTMEKVELASPYMMIYDAKGAQSFVDLFQNGTGIVYVGDEVKQITPFYNDEMDLEALKAEMRNYGIESCVERMDSRE